MLFPSQLISSLQDDHDELRFQTQILKDVEKSLLERHDAFDELVVILTSHTKREEEVVYNFMKTLPQLRMLAEEGYEEHRMVDYVVNRLLVEKDDETWTARAKMLAEFLESHLEEEEENVFPLLKGALDTNRDRGLSAEYEDFNRIYTVPLPVEVPTDAITRFEPNEGGDLPFDRMRPTRGESLTRSQLHML